MPPTAGSDWDHLGEALTERRVQIEPRYKNLRLFARETGLNWRLLFDIEHHKRETFEPETLMAIASAYRVTYRSVRDFRAGGELEPLPSAPAEVTEGDPAPVFSLKDVSAISTLVARVASLTPVVEAQVGQARMRLQNRNPAGMQIFRDDLEIAAWDIVAPEATRIGLVAYLRAKRLQEEDHEPNPGYPPRAQ